MPPRRGPSPRSPSPAGLARPICWHEVMTTMDDVPTPTIFRRYRDGDIIALFPTIPADLQGNCLSYQHVGQHGAASPAHVIARTRPATPEEYAALRVELESIGYTLRVVRRTTRQMAEERLAEARRASPQ
jgi:hypothetical protein